MVVLRRIGLVVTLCCGVAPGPLWAEEAVVLSAETLKVGAHSYRLVGIDAPEPGQRCWLKSHLFDCAEVAMAALTDLVTGGSVVCRTLERLRSNRSRFDAALRTIRQGTLRGAMRVHRASRVTLSDGPQWRTEGRLFPHSGRVALLNRYSSIDFRSAPHQRAGKDGQSDSYLIEAALEPPEAAEDGLPVALCRSDGYDLSEGMIYTGWALADPATGSDYQIFEEGARQAGRGLWRGRFVEPWAWRDGVRLPEERDD